MSSTCSYCNNPDNSENISHLFWFCFKVQAFIDTVSDFISSTGLNFTPTKNQFLFGIHNEAFHSPKNYLMLIMKKYIWLTKFKTAVLTLVGFKSLLKSYLNELKHIFVIKNLPETFNEWNTLYNLL